MWFKTRYVRLLEQRIAQFERERLQLIEENKKLIDRLIESHGFRPIHYEKTVKDAIKEAEELANAGMNLFSDLDEPEIEDNKLEKYDA